MVLIPEQAAKAILLGFLIGWALTLPIFLMHVLKAYRAGAPLSWGDFWLCMVLLPVSWPSAWIGFVVMKCFGRPMTRYLLRNTEVIIPGHDTNQ